ncbi:hypothetical protein Q9233_002221 [Columba guinea]|nr:hypothetical protein Q9233_002221 [Columba guinea]
MAGWPSLPPQKYLLTLGFRNKHIGKVLERWSSRKLPIFSDRKAPFCPLTSEETKRYWDNTGKSIVPVIDFIRSTKLTINLKEQDHVVQVRYVVSGIQGMGKRNQTDQDNRCACSPGIEKLHYASLLGRLGRAEEQSQVINQAMAELATIPYLQDISQQDAKLLQSLMADAMDILEGRSDKGRVWNKIQQDVKWHVQLLGAEHSPCRWDAMLLTSSQAQTVAHMDTVWVRGFEVEKHNPNTNSAKDRSNDVDLCADFNERVYSTAVIESKWIGGKRKKKYEIRYSFVKGWTTQAQTTLHKEVHMIQTDVNKRQRVQLQPVFQTSSGLLANCRLL